MRLRKRDRPSSGEPPEQWPAYEESARREALRPHITVTEEVVVTVETVEGGIETEYHQGAILDNYRTLASNSDNAPNSGDDPLVYTEGDHVVIAEGDHIVNANGGHMVITGGSHPENTEGDDREDPVFGHQVDL